MSSRLPSTLDAHSHLHLGPSLPSVSLVRAFQVESQSPLFSNGIFIAGFAGSAPVAIGGGSVGDLFSEKDRASAMALFSLGPLIGQFGCPRCQSSSDLYLRH